MKRMRARFKSLAIAVLTAALPFLGQGAAAAEAELPTLAVIGFDLVDDHPDPAPACGGGLGATCQ